MAQATATIVPQSLYSLSMIARAVNSIGLGMIGGGSLEAALSELESGAADAVVVLENDLHRHDQRFRAGLRGRR